MAEPAAWPSNFALQLGEALVARARPLSARLASSMAAFLCGPAEC